MDSLYFVGNIILQIAKNGHTQTYTRRSCNYFDLYFPENFYFKLFLFYNWNKFFELNLTIRITSLNEIQYPEEQLSIARSCNATSFDIEMMREKLLQKVRRTLEILLFFKLLIYTSIGNLNQVDLWIDQNVHNLPVPYFFGQNVSFNHQIKHWRYSKDFCKSKKIPADYV